MAIKSGVSSVEYRLDEYHGWLHYHDFGSFQLVYKKDKQTADDFVEGYDLSGSQWRGILNLRTSIRMNEAPRGRIANPKLSSAGVRAVMLILDDVRREEHFFPRYRIRSSTFSFRGRVFSLLWDGIIDQDTKRITGVERSTQSIADGPSGSVSTESFSQKSYFIITGEGRRYCTALSIISHDGEGVAAERCVKSNHAIAFTGLVLPNIRDNEVLRQWERPKPPLSISIVAEEYDEPTPASRIHFSVHTVHHNLKVKSFERVQSHPMQILHLNFDSGQAKKSQSSEERDLGHVDRRHATTLKATTPTDMKGNQAQTSSPPQLVDNPESAAEASILEGDEDLTQTIPQLPIDYFHHAMDQ